MIINNLGINFFKDFLQGKDKNMEKTKKIIAVDLAKNFDVYGTIHAHNKEKKPEKFFVLCGASCCGKDSLLKYLKDNYGLNTLISYTTRPKRVNEIDGKDYYFVKKNKFISMIENNEFIEYKKYIATRLENRKDVWFYGTSKKEFDNTKRKIGILDAKGIEKVKKYYGKDNIVVIFVDCNNKTRTDRAKSRKDFDEEKWEARCNFDEAEFSKDFVTSANFIIYNNANIENAEIQADKVMKAYNIKRVENEG